MTTPSSSAVADINTSEGSITKPNLDTGGNYKSVVKLIKI